MVLNSQGEVLATGALPDAPPYISPPRSALEIAGEGQEAPVEVTENPDTVRALYPLPGYGDAFLYVVRPLAPGLVAQMRSAVQSIDSYREAQESRARIQSAFILSYLETALLVLVGAVWAGDVGGQQHFRPYRAAGQGGGSDRGRRPDRAGRQRRRSGEIATLSDAFNRMTGDLQDQQSALKAASDEAQDRSRFIETVLSGVSAGVIGWIGAAACPPLTTAPCNCCISKRLRYWGMNWRALSPELSDLVRRAEAHIEEDIDVSRGGDTRRLRVRIEGGQGGEMVLTFDDITRLVTAQRNAAWRDVARRIAHEIKNPLTPIQLSAERLKRKYRARIGEDVEIFDRCTDTIIRQVGDIGRMVDEFSSFARMPAPRFAPSNPAEMLREAVFAQRVAAPRYRCGHGRTPARGVLESDGRMVGQALLNILKNAGESVAARRAAAGEDAASDDPAVIASLSIEDGNATFVIEDDGVGLPARDRDRPDRTLCHHAREGHGPGPGHRQTHLRGPRRRTEAGRRPDAARGARVHDLPPETPRQGRRRRGAQAPDRRRRIARQDATYRFRHSGRRRRSRHPRPRLRPSGGRGARRARRRQLRRSAGRDPRQKAVAGDPGHLDAGRRPGRAGTAGGGQGTRSRPAGGDDLGPRQYRDGGHGVETRRL